MFLCLFGQGGAHVAHGCLELTTQIEASLEFLGLLPLPAKSWDYRCVSLCQALCLAKTYFDNFEVSSGNSTELIKSRYSSTNFR